LAESNDHELIKELIYGQKDAQRNFFDRYYNGVLRYLIYHGKARCQSDAEEIADDTFLRAFRDIKNFQGKSSLKTWLFRIVDHAAIDFYRSPKNKLSAISLEENTQIYDSLTTTHSSPEQRTPEQVSEILKKEQDEKIRECLQQLNKEHQTVVVLRLIDGCSVKETAQIMGKTEAAVKMLFFRAWEKLSEIIKEHPYFKDYQFRSKKGGDLQ